MKKLKYTSLLLSAALFGMLSKAAQAQDSSSTNDPLISKSSNIAIYIGLALLVIATAFAINSLSTGLEKTLVFSFALAAIAILIALAV